LGGKDGYTGSRQKGRRPWRQPSDGSGFTSRILAEYLSDHGIKHIFARPYLPQGRGKIERFNRRILCAAAFSSFVSAKNWYGTCESDISLVVL